MMPDTYNNRHHPNTIFSALWGVYSSNHKPHIPNRTNQPTSRELGENKLLTGWLAFHHIVHTSKTKGKTEITRLGPSSRPHHSHENSAHRTDPVGSGRGRLTERVWLGRHRHLLASPGRLCCGDSECASDVNVPFGLHHRFALPCRPSRRRVGWPSRRSSDGV